MILPEEIDNQQFEVSFRGYNAREVDEFLNKIRMELEEMVKEQEVLRKKVAAAELIAKDAKDNEEEFVASMQADRDATTEALEAAKAEGERIIREAKNAATGIMAEVRRRAGDISAESRKAVQNIAEEAQRKAAEITEKAEADAAALSAKAREEANVITGAAKAAAEEKIYSARTEADNIVKAAKAHARAIEAEAKEKRAAMLEAAEKNTAICAKFMEEVRTTVTTVCREMDLELRNSVARVALIGKKAAALNIAPPATEETAPVVEEAPVEETPAVEEVEAPAEEEIADIPETAEPIAEKQPEPEIKKSAHAVPAPQKAGKVRSGGYFTDEYRQVMEELFGEDAVIPGSPSSDDDDTYDYLSKSDDDDVIDDNDDVVTEYTGMADNGEDVLEVFSNSTIERIYKSPTAEDIQDIMNEY